MRLHAYSATYMYPINFTAYLGDVTRNGSGHIIGAKATLHQWFMEINRTAVTLSTTDGAMSGMNAEVTC